MKTRSETAISALLAHRKWKEDKNHANQSLDPTHNNQVFLYQTVVCLGYDSTVPPESMEDEGYRNKMCVQFLYCSRYSPNFQMNINKLLVIHYNHSLQTAKINCNAECIHLTWYSSNNLVGRTIFLQTTTLHQCKPASSILLQLQALFHDPQNWRRDWSRKVKMGTDSTSVSVLIDPSVLTDWISGLFRHHAVSTMSIRRVVGSPHF